MGRTVRGCSVPVEAHAELAMFKPLKCVASSPASEQGPCLGSLLSHLLYYPGRDVSLGHSLSHSTCVCPGDGCSLKQPKNCLESGSFLLPPHWKTGAIGHQLIVWSCATIQNVNTVEKENYHLLK